MLIKIKKLLFSIKENKIIYYLMVLALFGYLSRYIFNVVLAHYLKPSLFGDFNIAVRVLGILTSFALLGTNYSTKRFFSSYLHRHDENGLQNYIQWNLNIIRFPFILCCLIALVTYLIMHKLHVWRMKDIQTYHLAIYMFWVAPLSALLSLLSTYLLCAQHPIFYKWITNMVYFLATFIFLLIVYAFHISFDSYRLVSVLLLSFSGLIFITIVFIIKKTPHLFRSISIAIRFKAIKFVHPDWKTVSMRMAANGLISLIIFSLDLIMLELISPIEDSVGLYAAALTISTFLIVIPQNLYTVLSLQVHELCFTSEGRKKLEKNIMQLNRSSMIITLFFGVAILTYSETLLLHFGPSYLQAELILKILIFGFIVNAFGQAPTTVLSYGGYEKWMIRISMLELLLLLSLCGVLTYFFGIVGTATATSLTLIIKTLFSHYIVYRQANIRTYLI